MKGSSASGQNATDFAATPQAALTGNFAQGKSMRLIAERLTASRGSEPIFADLSLTVEAGEALIVTGPNGIGKSTLLRVIAGLLKADSGIVTLDGGPQEAETLAEACHYLGHRNGMKRELTVAENLGFWQRFMAAPALGVEEAADAVGLATVLSLPYGYLSAGQQRRIAMARLLVSHRPIWILDEPTAALDVASEVRFGGMVEAHLRTGGLALIATHQPLAISTQREFAMTPGLTVSA
jgi:heme exporter protein A